MNTASISAVEPVEEAGRAELLLHPLRQRILKEAREASTAAEIARRVGLPPQKVNYHVRTLADAGFLRLAGEGRKRNLIEKRYRASARSYVLLPQVLGETGPGTIGDTDRLSAAYLMHLSARVQQELAAWLEPDKVRDGLPTLSMDAEVRFESAEQRAAFAEALRDAVTRVIGEHTAPSRGEEGKRRPGRAYRLVVGCYPIHDPQHDARGDEAGRGGTTVP